MAKQNSKAFKEERKKASAKAMYIGTAVALVLIGLTGLIVWLVQYNSNVTVYQVGEQAVKKDLYTCAYYYSTMTSQDWKSQGFDVYQDPYEQKLGETVSEKVREKFENWGEYFESLTNDGLKFILVMQDTATKGGYTYTQEVQDKIDQEWEALQQDKPATMNFQDYMLRTYGAPIKSKTFQNYLTMYHQAAQFYKDITESKALFNKYIGGTAADFESTYQAHRDELDVVSIRYFSMEDTPENAAKIEALKNAADQKEFGALCNEYKNDETYTKEDQSLFKDVTLMQVNQVSKSVISKTLTSQKTKEGDICYSDYKKDGKTFVEIVCVVKPRGKNMNAYNESDVKQWEFGAMGVLLEEYYDAHYTTEVSQKGIEAFREDMIIPQEPTTQKTTTS
ncbi:MAG: hypothetical protein IJI67_05870 [Clostridia bacterium]|nr:hypothetical protein [Clostridia bacterium]